MEVMEEDKVRSHRTVLPPVEVVEDPYPRTDRPFLSAEALRITLLLARIHAHTWKTFSLLLTPDTLTIALGFSLALALIQKRLPEQKPAAN
jgi:hypothetical protein